MQYFVIALVLFITVSLEPVHANNKSYEYSQLLDINAAGANELAEALPGIGPAKAALIVQWREQNGMFKNVEQLQEVKGIGPKTVEKLRAYIRVGSEAAARQMGLQRHQEENKVRADIHRLINAATYSARPESIQSLPRTPWYRKSALEILRAH